MHDSFYDIPADPHVLLRTMVPEVDNYLLRNNYRSLADWATDSDYLLNDDGEWIDAWGDPIMVLDMLMSILTEDRRVYTALGEPL